MSRSGQDYFSNSYSTPDLDQASTNTKLWVENLGSILKKEYPKPEPLIDGLLYTGDQALVFGKAGSGKSYITMKMMLHLAMGKDFAFYTIPKPKKVLYVDGEISPEMIQSRYLKMKAPLEDINKWEQACENLMYISRFLTPQSKELNLETGEYEIDDNSEISLRTLEEKRNMQQLMNTIIVMEPDVVVLDNIFTLFAFEDYSSPTEWILHVMPLLNFLRKENIACWIVDHANKGNGLFGTMSKQVTLDLLIRLESERQEIDIHDEQDEKGIDFSFKFSFEKARRLTSIQQQEVDFEMINGDVILAENRDRTQLALAKKYYEQGLSLRAISEKIMEEISYNISYSKIKRWADKEGWEKGEESAN
jgi:KaiC/GvpD/RAD55 family RecA-like ATPase